MASLATSTPSIEFSTWKIGRDGSRREINSLEKEMPFIEKDGSEVQQVLIDLAKALVAIAIQRDGLPLCQVIGQVP